MDKKSKYGSNNHLKYLKYFRNGLSNREKHAFEKSMMQDKFEEEAFEGLSKLISDFEDLHNRITREKSKKLVAMRVFQYAAGIILLLSLGSLIYLLTHNDQSVVKIAENIKNADTLNNSIKAAELLDSGSSKTLAQQLPEEKESPYNSKIIAAPANEASTEELAVGSNTVSDIEVDEISKIDDVVVIGYGVQKKIELTGATVSKDYPDLHQVDQALQGKAAGVDVSRSASQPGVESNIYIRGIGTITSNSNIITGRVTDASSQGLPGVSVIVKGSSDGTITDINGNFSIPAQGNLETTLVFSYLGFVTEEVDVTGNSSVNVFLQEDLLALEEVVVVGYGSQKKSELAGSTATIRMDEEYSAAPVIIHPKPVGGLRQLKEHINKSINYNNLPDFDEEVVIKLSFTIGVNGDLSNIEVTKSAGEAFDSEALRLIRTGPLWTPATKNGDPFEEKVSLKVKLQPEDKK
jgi:hypothetical protein